MANRKSRQDQQELYVVKANDLIRKTRYDLTTQQQKIMLFAISKIKPDDDINQWYEFSIKDMCAVCGFNIDKSGEYYTRLKADLHKLTFRQWCQMPDKSERTVSWIGDAVIIPLNGTVQIRFHEAMKPYLFELKNNYTQYMLQDVLVFRNKYSIRIYELLKSYVRDYKLENHIRQTITLDLSDLKDSLQTPEGFKTWTDFKRFVLMPAIQEINSKSDKIHIDVEPIRANASKRGKITRVNFVINAAGVRQIMTADQYRKQALNV